MEKNIPDEIVSVSNKLETDSTEKIREKLIALLNEIINKDFNSLVQLLYRIDVNEKKIRLYLKEKLNEDSSSVIADLIIERQLQKIESRKKFSTKNGKETDEEKW